jgi:hypothetical protein
LSAVALIRDWEQSVCVVGRNKDGCGCNGTGDYWGKMRYEEENQINKEAYTDEETKQTR